jgi:hypothetical protein
MKPISKTCHHHTLLSTLLLIGYKIWKKTTTLHQARFPHLTLHLTSLLTFLSTKSIDAVGGKLRQA